MLIELEGQLIVIEKITSEDLVNYFTEEGREGCINTFEDLTFEKLKNFSNSSVDEPLIYVAKENDTDTIIALRVYTVERVYSEKEKDNEKEKGQLFRRSNLFFYEKSLTESTKTLLRQHFSNMTIYSEYLDKSLGEVQQTVGTIEEEIQDSSANRYNRDKNSDIGNLFQKRKCLEAILAYKREKKNHQK